jgi:hypothetical protein
MKIGGWVWTGSGLQVPDAGSLQAPAFMPGSLTASVLAFLALSTNVTPVV